MPHSSSVPFSVRSCSINDQVSANVRVFISYAHRDGSTLASQLYHDLEKRGYAVWLDAARLRGGSNWSGEIEEPFQGYPPMRAVAVCCAFGADVQTIIAGDEAGQIHWLQLFEADPTRPAI